MFLFLYTFVFGFNDFFFVSEILFVIFCKFLYEICDFSVILQNSYSEIGGQNLLLYSYLSRQTFQKIVAKFSKPLNPKSNFHNYFFFRFLIKK